MLIQRLAPSQLNPTRKVGLYSRFQAQIKAIAASADYYPIRYHALLLEQSLQRLVRPRFCLQGVLRRVVKGLKEAIYPGQKDDLLKGCQNWYDGHQALSHFGLLSLKDPAKYRVFEACLQRLKAQEATMRKGKARKALRFGSVEQLRMLALRGGTGEVRKQKYSVAVRPSEAGRVGRRSRSDGGTTRWAG